MLHVLVLLNDKPDDPTYCLLFSDVITAAVYITSGNSLR